MSLAQCLFAPRTVALVGAALAGRLYGQLAGNIDFLGGAPEVRNLLAFVAGGRRTGGQLRRQHRGEDRSGSATPSLRRSLKCR